MALDWIGQSLLWYAGTLDGFPESARAAIAAALLLVLLRFARTRIPARDVQLSSSFGKLSLIALALVPAVIWMLPASRIAVFVEELDASEMTLYLPWAVVVLLWAAGALATAVRFVFGYARDAGDVRTLSPLGEDHPLMLRLRHWQRRLGRTGFLELALTDGDRPLYLVGTRRIVLPRGVTHWPAAAQDFIVIRELCRRRKHQGRWYLWSRLVACCYWPVPWVRSLGIELMQDLEAAVDHLAASCYRDSLGYGRALRQVQQRLTTPGGAAGPLCSGSSGACEAPKRPLADYWTHLGELWSADTCPDLNAELLTAAHWRCGSAVWTEPGEKLALLTGQAVFLAVILAGVTLEQAPPEVERDYAQMLDDSWMKAAFRNPERFSESTGPRDDGDPTARVRRSGVSRYR